MSTIVMHNLVSVDGYIADDNDDVGPLFDWYSNGDTELTEGGGPQVWQASADYVRAMWARIGSMMIGRPLFDMTNGWEGTPPAGEQVVVVSHRAKPDGWHPEASYRFVDDVQRRSRRRRSPSTCYCRARPLTTPAGTVSSTMAATVTTPSTPPTTRRR